MGTVQTLLTGATFGDGATAILDYLHGEERGIAWAVTRQDGGAHEVLDVRDPLDRVRRGDWLDPASQEGERLVEPILGQGGEELGALWGIDRGGSGALRPQQPLVELLARLLTTVLTADRARVASARRSEVLHLQAHSDDLTGLPNRRGWSEILEVEQPRYLDEPHGPSVIVIDLDRLKEVNDVQGHVAGDEYLQLAAVTLAAAGRESDFVARLGGDEFGVLVGASGPDAAEHLVARIREAFDAAGVAASIGCAHYQSEGGLVRTWWRADQAMYAEKQRRRGVVDLRVAGRTGKAARQSATAG